MQMRRKRRGPVAVPIASMGDIAFLLIIFFMVCSNFVKESNVQYKSPTASDVDPVDATGVSVVLDQEGKIFLEGKRVPDADTLKSVLETMFEKQKSGDASTRSVLFKCDVGMRLELFQPVMEAIVGAGGTVVAVGDPRTAR